MLTLTHIQKDDSPVPILPYAAGCFLAAILLTISGIAETHPQALSLAIDLIQLGWLLLQIQGVLLVQSFGTSEQCMTLFHVWLVTIQLLDVHRRGLQTFVTAMPMGGDWSGVTTHPAGSLCRGNAGGNGCRYGNGLGHGSDFGQGQGHATITAVRAFYTSMLCNAACDVPYFASGPTVVTQGDMVSSLLLRTPSAAIGTTLASEGIAGMREMEYLVLFEMVAGLGVSGILFLAWVAMAMRQGQGQGSRYTMEREGAAGG